MPDEQPVTTVPTTTEREFDLSPSPRILPMLGEISLEHWQCIAELIDNAIDGFLMAARQGRGVEHPEINVHLPTRRDGDPRITVRDNGPGMTPEKLEQAVKAGWTSNDPIASLGMFGMGFNIATARLGTVTQVWSTQEGDEVWHGVEIDFQKLIEQRHFRTPMLVRHKADPLAHGTEVTIRHLKPDQADWFARSGNHSRIRRELSRVYSAMLREPGVPLTVTMRVSGNAVQAYRHCVWGGPESPVRVVEHPRYGEIHAYITVDHALPSRPYCLRCWYWLSAGEEVCAACGSSDRVVERERQVRGWLGIQRYLDQSDYGIDFIRNGRKIERGNKELFSWPGENGLEREYPIDDPRHRGRIVGEIHLDHCRVYYTKDRFDRNDPAWNDMVRLIRGEGPLRPDKARALGFGENNAPLFKLFQAFRRSTPKPKVAGAYAKLLAVPDNDLAKEMADRFHAGDVAYQSDEKWWALVEEADRQLLVDDDGDGDVDDFWEGGDTSTGEADDDAEQEDQDEPPPPRDEIPSLTREYRDEVTSQRWDVHAFAVRPDDPGLGSTEVPWVLRRTTSGPWEFLVNRDHSVFRSATLTPLDALLCELAWSAMDHLRGRQTNATYALVLAALRQRYASRSELDPVALSNEAALTLKNIARSLARNVDEEDARALFDDLSATEQRHVLGRLASAAGADGPRLIAEGRFLEYAPRTTILRFFNTHPELFFDGRYWDVPYESLDLGDSEVTADARRDLVRRYSCLLADAIWLADHDPEDIETGGRERMLRAMLALELLAADVLGEE